MHGHRNLNLCFCILSSIHLQWQGNILKSFLLTPGSTNNDQWAFKVKSKANTLQAWTVPDSSRRLRGSQISRQSAHEGGKVVNPTHRAPLTPRKYFWYSFLLYVECDQKDYINKKFQWNHRKSNPGPSGLERIASTNCATAYPALKEAGHLMVYVPKRLASYIRVPIVRTKQDHTTDLMIKRDNGIVDGKYDLLV